MTIYAKLIVLCALSLGFYSFAGGLSTLNFDSYLELIGGLTIFGMIVYNEIRQNRQLSVIDLVSLREETLKLQSNIDVIEEKLEHKAFREEFLEYKLELNNQIEELSSSLRTQVNNVVDALSMNQEGEEYYEEEEVKQKAPTKKGRSKK